jgi:hypothetical protein
MLAYTVTKGFSHGFISYSEGDLLIPEAPAVKVYNLEHNIKPVFVLDVDELKGVMDEIENVNPDDIKGTDLSKLRKLLKDLQKLYEKQEKKYGK